MKKAVLFIGLSLLSTLISYCKKEKKTADPITSTPAPVSNSRQVQYEIKGNYSGYLFVVYYDNVSGNTTDTVKSLPWSKSITYGNTVQGIGIGANSVSSNLGGASQSATLQIISGGNVVKSQSATTDANGIINFQSVAYVFPQ